MAAAQPVKDNESESRGYHGNENVNVESVLSSPLSINAMQIILKSGRGPRDEKKKKM